MDKLVISGPNKLSGEVSISSSKNATLPILAGSILFPQEINFIDLPQLSDIKFFIQILESLGATTSGELDKKIINTATLDNTKADYDLVRKMRASVLVLGPLLSRFKKAKVSLPGGCAIGTRPVDIHLKGLEKMGAKIEIEKGYIDASVDGELQGAHITLEFPSVGATENLMMAAVWANGETIIENAAREPEISDHANFLKKFGVEIDGAGTSTITIKGQKFDEYKARDVNYKIIGDRIEAATYVIAGLMTNSEITVKDFNPTHIESVLDTLQKMGAKLEIGSDFVKTLESGRLRGAKVDTAPYPGFPTDAQAQLMALMGVSDGISVIRENIFENRYMHVPELVRLGMDIELDRSSAIIEGVEDLSSAPVMCTDLRASAALVLAALMASGETHIGRIYHLDRGYERLYEKLAKLGAKILRIKE